ncbi:heptaprenyl diphosphate synthase component 1 [Tuberibacillus sp. Marseille-P3662]|uniref:heptaprenyl diphosphate synthase component 1 n=1 Tax=Tuberibacillus sp. Marseille-P3662 TaxID=1965358 RepID=UPI0015944465|nr:heptaprenyl diphosphate synthase component 1 [Tuberibacillus sp. Marseille-P3662]
MTENRQLKQLMDHIKQYIQQPYLSRFIKAPDIDEEQVDLLYQLAQPIHENTEDYVASIVLVQTALNTHDTISVDASQVIGKERELTVLAGDYYSALYYYLLSTLKDNQTIKAVSEGIKAVNEAKMALYKNDLSWAQMLSTLRVIETTIIDKVCLSLGYSEDRRIIQDYFYLKRLWKEKNLLVQGEGSSLFEQAFKKRPDIRSGIIQVFEDAIQGLLPIFVNGQKPLPRLISDVIKRNQWLNQFQGHKLIAEEGS